MFDRLVESEPASAVPSRRNYFIVTTFAMIIVSLTAVVVSIFADDYSLNAGIELSALIAPVQMAAVVPDKPQPRQPMPRTQTTSTQIAMRTENVRNIAELPDQVPPISTTRTNVVARPIDIPFTIGRVNADPGDRSGRGIPDGNGSNSNGISQSAPTTAVITEEPPPPPVRKAEPKPTQSGGVLNGKAVALPVPSYPAAARAVGAQGKVTVQVTLDETGKVISATAVDGNPLLRGAAVDAARRARFTPTLLTGVPVKVTGVIVYNFNRG